MYDENELFEIYRVKVCTSCKSFDACELSKSFFDNKFEVKVFKEKGNEPSYIEYKCLEFK